MAAGLGFKTFTTGEVLTAADTNGYLMQGILVFATEAARNSAITSPQEGQFAFTKDTNSTWFYDGAAWVASGASGDVTGVTAGNGISVTSPTGPVPTVAIDTTVTADLTTAQTLTNKKLSDSTTTIVDVSDATKAIKFDVAGTTAVTGTIATAFTTAKTLTLPDATDTLVGRATTDTLTNKTLTSPALTTPTISTLTTNGDLLYGTGSGALTRLGIGSTSQVLTVTGGVPVWATPGGASGPAFKASKSADQGITASTFTKVTFNTEEFDTAGNFASSTFTPTTAGYYQLSAFAEYSGGGTVTSSLLTIYKNGARAGDFNGTPSRSGGASDLFYANGSTDYFEVYVILTMSSGGESITGTDAYRTRFAGVWIRS